MNDVKCSNCGQENKNTNIRCESCGTELNHLEQNDNFLNKNYSQTNVKTINLGSKKVNHIASAILIFKFAPLFLIGLVFLGLSLYFIISDNNKSKNYLETEGKLVSYENCQYDDTENELCDAVYEYKVNGMTYKGSPNLLSNRSGFKQTIIVKYNPNNPSEYIMNSGWKGLLFVGIIIITIVLAICILIKNFIKKLSEKVNDIKKRQSDISSEKE